MLAAPGSIAQGQMLTRLQTLGGWSPATHTRKHGAAPLPERGGVSPARSARSPMALLLGKPVLVTRSGGANSLVNEEVAIVVDRESTTALVNGMKEMITRLPSFDGSVIENYALENFEIDQVSRQYMTLYEDLIEQRIKH